MTVALWIIAMIVAAFVGWAVGAAVILWRDRAASRFEIDVWMAYTEANRRYAAMPPETTTLERLAFLYGPDGAGLILGVKR